QGGCTRRRKSHYDGPTRSPAKGHPMADFTPVPTLEGDARFDAYVARPEGSPKAAIIVIQEIFGVNEGIRRKCDNWAQAGYLAVAPDLFWRLRPHIELDADVPAEMEEALGLFGKFDQDKGVRDLEPAIRFARKEIGGGKVGVVGYCLGGRLAFMSACRTDGDAFVGYYGVGIDNLIGESHAIGKPVLLHVPTADGFVSAEVQ